MKFLESRICLMVAAAIIVLCAETVSAGEYTDVIDAFDRDNGDPFDLNIGIGYQRYQEKGVITRETINDGDAMPVGGEYLHRWDYYPKYKFAEYEHAQNILNINLSIGLFRDLMVRMDLPIILSDDRSLTSKDTGWGDETALFSRNFRSPQRSGVDYLAAGIWWNVLDQSRTKEHPTLTGIVEGRFGVGDQLNAACVNARNEVATVCENDTAGISHHTNQLRLGLRFSRRYGLLEPYMGIDGMVGWYKGKDLTMELGALNDLPPLVGTFEFGMELVPWEVPELERKLVIVFGGGARYHSEGRTYTPLFDALGTSSYFASNADINDSGTTGDFDREADALNNWTGMTDIENYGEFFGTLAVAIQPAKYVKFKVGLQMGHKSEHFITKTDQCPAGSVNDQGICENYNLGHRPVIDKPGFRFRAEESFIWALFLDATAQF